MSTFIHGIAASENIDSSGERLSILGMDISSLEKDGVFNWEHKADQPGQVVGKILKAKKIFSDQDCEDDYQLEFLKKCGVPYLYVMGELMDDYKESAKEVAGMFRYDSERPGQKNTSNFSIEGAKIEKQGMDVIKSIARKVTITVTPCNKVAEASMVAIDKKPKSKGIDELFKTEAIEIELIKDEGFTMGTLSASEKMTKDQPKLTVATPAHASVGSTKSGKPVLANAKVHQYKDFSEQDHRDASTLHLETASKLGETDFKQAQFHRNKGLLHNAAANTMNVRATRSGANRPVSTPTPSPTAHWPRFPISLTKSEIFTSETMTDEESNSLMNRTEDKYFISKTALEYLTQAIKENLKEGDVDTEVRYNTNRSIYLDNQDLDSLKDTLNNIRPRIKIRIRQYSPNGEGWEKIAYVEIKVKEEDGSSKKLRIRIHSENVDSFVEGKPLSMSEDLANINKDITRQILEQRIVLVNHLVSLYGYRKQVELQYERRAYTGKDVRVTIDENLRFLDHKEISHDNVMAVKCTEGWVNIFQLDHQLKNDGYLILEVKHQGEMPKWVEKALENSQAKKVKFSKYASAMSCVIESKSHEGFISSASILHESPIIVKALDAGSGMAAPGQLVGGAALAKESIEKKPKSKWLLRAEAEYSKWTKREEFESFMSKRLPHLTKGEIRAIGQVMALNKSMVIEKTLNELEGYDKLTKELSFNSKLEKAGGKNSIYTLILFEGCELHDILHCSHFATDDMDGDTYDKIKEVCDKYFEKGIEAKDLEFKESGELGPHKQKVLFLTNGDPYKELFEELKKVAKYKYDNFTPHVSVTSNVDEFKGKAVSLVISMDGEVKKKYDFK